MRARVPVVVAVVSSVVVLAACDASSTAAGPSTPTSSAAAPATSPSGPASPSPGPTSSGDEGAGTSTADLADGRHPAHIVAVDATGRHVTVDVVQVFTGSAAATAAAADGASEVPPPNDYWIRNSSPRLRTLPVSAAAPVTTNTLTASLSGSSSKDVALSLSRLRTLDGLQRALFWLTVRDGEVTRIAEQYLP
jgi:hypothetical protein